ncbi:MAG: class I SAM-dependent methyltransferase [Acidobacteriia bacterium]|nr:class I SAM-dependent methyltransferase [Terriglobia bacterium]
MEWFEDEDFWRELYPYMFPPDRIAAAADQVAQFLALTKVEGGAVLDLCCGPGRHSVEFARLGLNVTGVDRTPFLLDRARERAQAAGVKVEWVLDDMRNFRRPAAFDLACSLFTSFGYFDNPDEDLLVLRNVHASLKPGGVFVLETLGKERLARVLLKSICEDFPDGAVLLQRPQVRDDWSRVSNEWTLLKDGRYRTFRFEHTIYSGRELKERLISSGFADVKLFGDPQGGPYGPDALRLVAVARKAS